jgi:hypothetical protein
VCVRVLICAVTILQVVPGRTGGTEHGGDAAYMLWPYKLLVGKVEQSGWCGPVHPNITQPWDSFKSTIQCNNTATGKLGCLFNVVDVSGTALCVQ